MLLDTIFIGTSGLVGFSQALRVIGNNLTNVNTPGFKGSQAQFADFFSEGNASHQESFSTGGNNSPTQLGNGLNFLATEINFRAGNLQSTGNDLDLAVNGNGYFVVHDGDKQEYTRAGQFAFNNGVLVSRTNGARVQGLDSNGKLTDISLDGLQSSPAKATSSVKFSGNLPSDTVVGVDVVVSAVPIFDAAGGMHPVSLTFRKNVAPPVDTWTVTIRDVTGVVGTGTLQFNNGVVVPGTAKINFAYSPAGVTPLSAELDFSSNVTSNASAGAPSTLAFASQNGFVAGTLTGVTFNADGKLQAAYSNAQTVTGVSLALARFDSDQDIKQLGGNSFGAKDDNAVHLGRANSGAFGSFSSGVIEGSNVDLAQEFSNLIVMQRGYQAASHVISTANEMIQELFDMKGHN
jgi:flagellar hook protein FlgE